MLSIINFIQVGDSFRAIKLCSSYQINVKMAQIFLNFTTVPGKVQGQIGRYACLILMNERFFLLLLFFIGHGMVADWHHQTSDALICWSSWNRHML